MGEDRQILIWGAGGQAKVVADIVRALRTPYILGFLDEVNLERHGSAFCDSKILGGQEQLAPLMKQGIHQIVIAIGDCAARLRASSIATGLGFELIRLCHPTATISPNAVIGPGSVLVAGTVVNPDCVIGSNVIVNTGATVDHDCVVEDGVHIGPGVHIGGNSRIGRGAWVGIGATVIDRVTIGAGTIIGAGAVVVHDIPENVVAYGVPARVMRKLL